MDFGAKIKLERKLKSYWKSKQKLQNLQRTLEKIDKDISTLRGILAEKDELIPSPLQISFTPGGGRGYSEFTPVEKSVVMYQANQEILQRKIEQLRQKKLKIQLRIMSIEYSTDIFDYISKNYLDDEELEIFEQCYLYCRNNIQVGKALNCDESTVRRKREKILSVFNEFLKIRA
jgi:peroxiredoxin family protein